MNELCPHAAFSTGREIVCLSFPSVGLTILF